MNNKLNISDRLKAIGDIVDSCDKVIDVGCDHALLSIYIYLNKTKSVIASDINENPLKEAYKNLNRYNLEDKIELRLSNGLKNFNSKEFDTIIISGMGGLTIIDILKASIDKLENTKKMIIQANKDIPKVRNFVTKIGYVIKDEILVKEKNIIYTIVVFEKTSNKMKYSKEDMLIGPILKNKKDKLLKELLDKSLSKKEKEFNLIPRKYILKRLRLKKEIKIITKFDKL